MEGEIEAPSARVPGTGAPQPLGPRGRDASAASLGPTDLQPGPRRRRYAPSVGQRRLASGAAGLLGFWRLLEPLMASELKNGEADELKKIKSLLET